MIYFIYKKYKDADWFTDYFLYLCGAELLIDCFILSVLIAVLILTWI